MEDIKTTQYHILHENDYVLMEDLPGVFNQLFAIMVGWTDR